MGVLEALSDEEAYLYAILSDQSGLDIAEFIWVDEEQPDAIYRAWPFQWKWYRCKDKFQIEQGARSIGKSMSIAVRALAFPFVHPGNEMVITAPESVHLEAITDKIETYLMSARLSREMLSGSGRNAFKHKPFHAAFKNGARIMGRIPQKDGKGIKGTHPLWLEQDEASDYPEAGWKEIVETLKTGNDGAVWRAHGVTRGVRDKFYEYTQPGSGWTIHHITAMARPTWTDQEREDKISQYGGSKDDPDYRRNVLGLHGDASSALFVLHRLMQCVDQDQTSDYNQNEYYPLRISAEMLGDSGLEIQDYFDPPRSHLAKTYLQYWIGMDVGYTNDPSEIVIFGETRRTKGNKKAEHSTLELLSKVSLHRLEAPKQARLIAAIVDFYAQTNRLKTFAMDSTGAGLPLFQILQDADWGKRTLDYVRGYNFSAKILVAFDHTVVLDEYKGDLVKDAGIEFNVKEYAQDCLRGLVDNAQILFPWDKPLIGQFQGGTATPKRGTDRYGRTKIFSAGEDHALDACRMFALSYSVYAIEELMKQDRQEEVLDTFMYDDDVW